MARWAWAGLAASVALAPTWPLPALGLAALGLVALRGCPMCWTVGLLETLAARLQGKRASKACLDGSCALQRRT